MMKIKNKKRKDSGFTLVEVLVTVFIFSVIVIGLQYTVLINYKNVDMIKNEVYFGDAPERNYNFIRNIIVQNQEAESTYSPQFVKIIDSGEGIQINLGKEDGVTYYGYIMLAGEGADENELYYHVSTLSTKTQLSDLDIEKGNSLLLCKDMDEIQFSLSADGLLTIEQRFIKEASGHQDYSDPDQILESTKVLKLYVYN